MENRILKFRAWDKHTKKMITDFVLAPTSPDWGAFMIRRDEGADKVLNNYWKSKGDILGGDYTSHDWSDYYALENLIVMQFTGLQFQGIDLYEGDVIEWYAKPEGYPESKKLKRHTKVIEIKNLISGCFLFNFHDYKVIGNIYENPDLLK